MAYNQKQLEVYRQLIKEGKPFRSATCPYCNGHRDATVKHIHPSTKPSSAWNFWNDVLVSKYAAVQSPVARANKDASGMSSSTEIRSSLSDSPAMLREQTVETDVEAPTAAVRRGSHMFVVGPMVDQSELPFRMLCRQYGATLAYTPMLHAKSFAESAVYRRHYLSVTSPDEVKSAMESPPPGAPVPAGGRAVCSSERTDAGDGNDHAIANTTLVDRPCIVQFCGNNADIVLRAARIAVLGEQAAVEEHGGTSHGDSTTPVYPVHVQVSASSSSKADTEHFLYQCDAVDLNLGCPQGIARRGNYGSFLMEDWELIHTIVHTLHVELEVPVTVKIRLFDDPTCAQADSHDREGATHCASATSSSEVHFDEALTILYARMIRDAGAQVLCIHGRTRNMKGQQTGLANMELIRRVRSALGGTIPVISNGNVLTYEDVLTHIRETKCEGHMCAEPLLWDPKLFSNPSLPVMPGRTHGANKATRLSALHTALVYMQWVRHYPVDIGFVKAHLFKMCFHSYELHPKFRDEIGQLKTSVTKLKRVERGSDTAEVDAMRSRAVPGVEGLSSASGTECEEGSDEESTAVAAATVAASVSASAFEQYIDAIEAHLRALTEEEHKCSTDGEQAKSLKAAKAKLKEKKVDIWAEEGSLGINF